jgi:hypothetical protein
MQQTTKPVSKLKVVLVWALLLGNLIFWVGFWAWRRNSSSPLAEREPGLDIARVLFMCVVGGFFFVAGVAGYFIVLATTCFTFDFTRPVFPAYKGKLYLAKIIVPTGVAIGAALVLSVFLEPLLRSFGLSGQVTFLVPLIAAIVLVQVAEFWINLWMPVTRRLIIKRLAARGIAPAQLQGAILVGISDPQRSSFKKLTLVEDDIGALWIGADQLIYWGDSDQFSIAPGQILELERRADAGSASMLSATAHVILHVQKTDGGVRQIRFHMEGHWTQGQNRRAMDTLAAAITAWHGTSRVIPPPIQG